MSDRHPTRRSLLAALVTATTAGCLDLASSSPPASSSRPTYGATDSPWPMLGHDRRNSGATGATLPDGSATARRLARLTADDRTDAPIYAADGVLVSRAGGEGVAGGAFAFAPETSERRWHNPDVVDYTTPSVYGETALFSGDGGTAAVDVATGEVHWRHDAGTSGRHETHLKGDDRVVVGGARRVVGLDAHSGARRWRSDRVGTTYGLAADDDGVYATTGGPAPPRIRAFDWSGATRWTVDAGAAVGYPVVADGRVFHLDPDDGRLAAFDAADGSRLWTYDAGAADAPPALSPDGDRLYLAGLDEPRVHVVATEGGRRVGTLPGRSSRQPLVVGDDLWLVAYDALLRVSRSDGAVLDRVAFPGRVTSPLSLGPDAVYCVARTGARTYFAYAVDVE